jgi:curved DNA-binding protein CbpA
MASVKRAQPDYYEVLGVPRDATYREIEAAYWRLAWRRRDRLPLLNEAWEILGDAKRRMAYNEERGAAPASAEAERTRPLESDSRLGTNFRW